MTKAPKPSVLTLPLQNTNQSLRFHVNFLSTKVHRSNWVFLGFPGGASGQEPALQCIRYKRWGIDPWVGKIPGGGHGNPLQSSYLENPMDRGAWQAAVHGVAQSQTTEAPQQQVAGYSFCLNDLGSWALRLITSQVSSFHNEGKRWNHVNSKFAMSSDIHSRYLWFR